MRRQVAGGREVGSRRRGAVAMETLLSVPLVGLLVAGAIGIADLIVAEQLVQEASARAARVAALGGDDAQIRQTVAAVLGSRRAQAAQVLVGSPADEPGPLPPGQLIEVRVELSVSDATVTPLVPLSGSETVVGRSVVLKE